ncbi:MAG: arsenate reductase (glutaredoxin) [Gammaproteobacteria bacterium]|nr:arsenate reductase (glutaredoxin) [Gammaproteobacteria bacterium]MYE30779.1 arsenate reductase (glutaredoxin) [Gammaproteobacteria bacterium]MYI01187.1 arsenate reductase (glutaredoxin) [Gammaproteobacteria bacterium]
MERIVVYHNPDCSKSLATLALLEENEAEYDVVHYLETPPNIDELKELLGKLGLGIRDLLRRNEPEYDDLGLGDEALSEEIVYDLVCNHPVLIQRPIVVKGDRAIVARPPEAVLALIGDDE